MPKSYCRRVTEDSEPLQWRRYIVGGWTQNDSMQDTGRKLVTLAIPAKRFRNYAKMDADINKISSELFPNWATTVQIKILPKWLPTSMKNWGCVADAFWERFWGALGWKMMFPGNTIADFWEHPFCQKSITNQSKNSSKKRSPEDMEFDAKWISKWSQNRCQNALESSGFLKGVIIDIHGKSITFFEDLAGCVRER